VDSIAVFEMKTVADSQMDSDRPTVDAANQATNKESAVGSLEKVPAASTL
jgi:hypothetical protein